MNPGDISTVLQGAASLFVLAGVVFTGFMTRYVARQNRQARQDRTPVDENEAARIAKEMFSTLLTEAREERKELRGTISDLKKDGTTKQVRIDALEAIDRKKTVRIEVLEFRARAAADKLAAGHRLTVVDILGDPTNPDSVLIITEGLPDDLEDTVTTL